MNARRQVVAGLKIDYFDGERAPDVPNTACGCNLPFVNRFFMPGGH